MVRAMVFVAWVLAAAGCTCSLGRPEAAVPSQVVVAPPALEKMYQTTNLGFATPTGEVVIVDEGGKRATFATKSGVVFKQVNLDKPEKFETHKALKRQIHNTKDALEVEAEWIGERVYWRIETSGLQTHAASALKLASEFGTPLVVLCDRCDWYPIFDSETGKTVRYAVEGVAQGVPIDVWTKTESLSFRAAAD